MKRILAVGSGILLAAAGFGAMAGSASARVAGWPTMQETAKQDTKDAGSDVKDAAKKTGRATKKGAQTAGTDTKDAAKKTGSATKTGTKKVVNKTASKTAEGADKVEDKTAPK